MRIVEIEAAVSRLSADQNCRVLARLAYELTIAARELYGTKSDAITDARQFRAINEIQHRVTSCLVQALRGKEDDKWLWAFVSEAGERAGLSGPVLSACSRAIQSVSS